jgi:hypothetical protein
MTRVSEWRKGKRPKPGDGALRIADAMGISDIEATSRYQPRAVPQPSNFVAMVIAEWHKLVADVSRAFARNRIHRAAAAGRQGKVRALPLRTPKQQRPD